MVARMRILPALSLMLLVGAATAQIPLAWTPYLLIKDDHARSEVITALSADWDAHSIRIIVAALMDPSPEVVGAARDILRNKKSHAVFDQLVAGMQNGSQYEAALLLADYTDHRYVRRMIRLLRSPEVNVRRPIALALGIMHDPIAYLPLRRALADREPNFHGEVVRALAHYGPPGKR
ncbi:MAG: HEAT repeat domain-containing protein [Fimbriimonadaceae bacterium]